MNEGEQICLLRIHEQYLSDSTNTYMDSVYLLLLSLFAMHTRIYDAYGNTSNLLLLNLLSIRRRIVCYAYVDPSNLLLLNLLSKRRRITCHAYVNSSNLLLSGFLSIRIRSTPRLLFTYAFVLIIQRPYP